jgi:transcriptional regulator with XRE-family HTH domain
VNDRANTARRAIVGRHGKMSVSRAGTARCPYRELLVAQPDQVTAAVARNVRAYRIKRKWTLDVLAARAGVSKGMLVQVEQGRTNPSIATLCRLADGLGVPLPRLVEVAEVPAIRIVAASDAVTPWQGREGSSAKLMVGSHPPNHVELWDWRVAVGDGYVAEPHPLGTRELLFVVTGTLALGVEGHIERATAGEAVLFSGDRAHEYHNGGNDPLHFVMFVTAHNPHPN